MYDGAVDSACYGGGENREVEASFTKNSVQKVHGSRSADEKSNDALATPCELIFFLSVLMDTGGLQSQKCIGGASASWSQLP